MFKAEVRYHRFAFAVVCAFMRDTACFLGGGRGPERLYTDWNLAGGTVKRMLFAVLSVLILSWQVAAMAFGADPQRPSTNDHYRNPTTGVEFDPPEGWSYEGRIEATSSRGRTERWTREGIGGANGPVSMNVWMPDTAVPAGLVTPNTDNWLGALIAQKARQRYQYPNWVARRDSISATTTGGLTTVVAVADWKQGGETPRVEYLTWIFGPQARAEFFAFAAPNQLDALRQAVDIVVRSARVP
jgi:hypothetical protein